MDYTKLRSYNLNEAKVGDKICCVTGVDTNPVRAGAVLAVKYGRLVIDWTDDHTFTVQSKTGYHQIKLTPLCWVEGLPVYEGDVLYNKELGMDEHKTQPCVVKKMSELYEGLVDYTRDGMPCKATVEELTWVKPVVTVNINWFDVPAPETEPPEEGTSYWIPVVSAEDFVCYKRWEKENVDNRFLERGLVHLTEEAARQHAKALLSFTEQGNNHA